MFQKKKTLTEGTRATVLNHVSSVPSRLWSAHRCWLDLWFSDRLETALVVVKLGKSKPSQRCSPTWAPHWPPSGHQLGHQVVTKAVTNCHHIGHPMITTVTQQVTLYSRISPSTPESRGTQNIRLEPLVTKWTQHVVVTCC